MVNDKWEWDRRTIKEYHEKHETYDWHQKMMLHCFRENPFFLDIWKSRGNIETKVLPSGLTILTKRSEPSKFSKITWEQLVLTDEGEVLDYDYNPKMEEPKPPRELTKEDLEKLRKCSKKRKGLLKGW